VINYEVHVNTFRNFVLDFKKISSNDQIRHSQESNLTGENGFPSSSKKS
jgi:hypothetical protein